MSLIKFLFVLLIIIPVGVVMIYIINSLNRDVRESGKNAERNRTAVKDTARDDARREKPKKKPERRYMPEHVPERTGSGRGSGGYGENTGSSRQELGGSFGREIPGRDRYKQESAYYINKQKRAAGGNLNNTDRSEKSKTNRNKTASKRKRRKERKNKKKVREK